MINDILEKRSITKYRLSKDSGVPYATIHDISTGKADIMNCNVDTVYKIAKALSVSIESLLPQEISYRPSFELFKSKICHDLKEQGDIRFILQLLDDHTIDRYYKRRWYPEALYLLAMLDYISRINGIPLSKEYDDLRKKRLKETVYPSSVIAMALTMDSEAIKENAVQNAIPEFMRHNIVESEIRDVV